LSGIKIYSFWNKLLNYLRTSPIYGQNYTRYQLNRNILRKFLRRYYLLTIAAQVKGKAVDFGCGVGELISYLPEGSIGLEINRSTVEYCKQIGLQVVFYDHQQDRYAFKDIAPNEYQTFIMNHVLEHIEDADMVLKQILISCQHLGIERIILVLPARKGFLFDATHKTFVTLEYLENKGLHDYAGFRITGQWYFPFNKKWIGNYFTYHELRIVYDQKKTGR